MAYFVVSSVSDGDLFLSTHKAASEEEGMLAYLIDTGFFDDDIYEIYGNEPVVNWDNFEKLLEARLIKKYGAIKEAFWFLTDEMQIEYKFLGG